MMIIDKPRIHVLSTPSWHPHPRYELPFHHIPGENIIATSGKVCYDSYGIDGNPVAKHIRNLMDSGHHSVIEHVHIGLFIEGISRGCSHEIVRHRMFNYSQRSTRYTAEDDAAIVLDPFYAAIYMRSKAQCGKSETLLLNGFIQQAESAFAAYRDQLVHLEQLAPDGLSKRDLRKWCRGKARQLLPHALETRMVMTGNLRAWRHFLLMRTAAGAEAEIRRLAHMIFIALEPLAPEVFADLVRTEVDGFTELTEA